MGHNIEVFEGEVLPCNFLWNVVTTPGDFPLDLSHGQGVGHEPREFIVASAQGIGDNYIRAAAGSPAKSEVNIDGS